MTNITFVFGTRPEFIKLIKLSQLIQRNPKFSLTIVSSGQQEFFLQKFKTSKISNINLNLGKFKNVHNFISIFLEKFQKSIKNKNVDYLLVQGDTSTAYATSLFGFLEKIPIIHLEAGLRTFDHYSPFPEEYFRQCISKVANIHLAQTESAKLNLINEGIKKNKIHVIGNPGIDYLVEKINSKNFSYKFKENTILITMHRREALDGTLETFIKNLSKFMIKNREFIVYWPRHTNPNILKQIKTSLKKIDKSRINFIKPLNYSDFLEYLKKVEFVITDSGGIQEEAAYLGKPLLIARDVTERQDIIELKLGKLIKADGRKLSETINFFKNNKISQKNKYLWKKSQGEGKSAIKINNLLTKLLN